MRHVRTVLQYAVMWVLVFVMSAGPLPLGIAPAHAANAPVNDVPGIKNYFAPKVFIIFDTSKSMALQPGDLNGDLSHATDDWDPSVPTPDANCMSKFCLGKRALYKTLPKYTSRLELGLSGYNQYYQLTTIPPTLYTKCDYDKIALGNATYGVYNFKTTLDINGATVGSIFSYQPGSDPWYCVNPLSNCGGRVAAEAHQTQLMSVSTDWSGDLYYVNRVGAAPPLGATLTLTLSNSPKPGTTDFVYTNIGPDPAPPLGYHPVSLGKAGVCAASIPGFTGGFGCTAAQPCDLTLTGEHTQYFADIWSGTDYGPTHDFGSPYTFSSLTSTSWTGDCGATAPYGGVSQCSGLAGGVCSVLTQTGGPRSVPASAVDKRFQPISPGPTWTALPSYDEFLKIQITTANASCPGSAEVITDSSGNTDFRPLTVGVVSPGQVDISGLDGQCTGSDPAYTCTLTMDHEEFGTNEINAHYCVFKRTAYPYQQFTTVCDYQAPVWIYKADTGVDYCDYKFYRDVYSAPIYNYSFVPNDGDLLGTASIQYNGRDDSSNPTRPTAGVVWTGDPVNALSNGDCPNIGTMAGCSGGVVCKLQWQSNTTIGANNYPAGRYSNSPWGWTPWATGLVRAADPAGTYGDPTFPPNPYGYKQDWLNGGGQVTQYFDYLVASIYQPSATNPPGSAFPCAGCTIQYSYVDPSNLTIDSSTRQVLPPTDVNAPTEFANAVTASGPMPPNKTSGWGETPPPASVPAISWTGLAQNNAVPGTPVGSSSDGPILRMLSKYDQAGNPAGLQMPQYGDYTPLTGSLKNAYDYIQGVIATDPYAGCGRNYYVMLLTDGEEQPANLGNDPVAAVQALRAVPNGVGTVDVKTFVIGFGLQSAQLDQMARAGGTAVAPDLETLDPNGGAFDASTPDRLLKSLEATFGAILSGYFTRSKPVVNLDGDQMYIGYFRLLFNGIEWQGKLDSIDLADPNKPLPDLAAQLPTDGTADSLYSFLWRYGKTCDSVGCSVDQGINSATQTSLTRTVYTSLAPNSQNRIYFDYPGGWHSNAGADQDSLRNLIGPVPADSDAAIALLLNVGAPGNPELFTTGDPKRSRASDIFHATPALVGGAAQSSNWPSTAAEAAGYTAFRGLVASRKKTVYIGANDAMLHAVEDAVTRPQPGGPPTVATEAGTERWAYVPNQILSRVSQFRDGHSYGVDGSVAVADVCGPPFSGSDCTTGLGWRTLLVGTFGKGGHGLYALDITDAASPGVLWEQSSVPDMVLSRGPKLRFGETWGPPVIARASATGPGTKWSVFVGGGVSPQRDTVQPWGNVFFVLDASTGQILTDSANHSANFSVWDDQNDVANPNGIATRPTLYRPGDGSSVDRVYFADTQGKMWKMSLTSPDISTWDPNPNRNALADATKAQDAFFDPFNKGGVGTCVQDVNGAAAQILDATTGAPTGLTLPLAGTSRPKIFNRPMIAFDTSGLLNVYLGTGDTEHPNDPLGTWDYFYGLQDTGSGCARPLFILRFAQNEKMLSDPAFLDGVIFGTTYTPPSGANVCTDAGHGFLYAWDAFTGQPVKAINDPFNVGVKVSKLDLSTNPQLGGSGIPSGPIVRNGKIYVSVETDPSHPRVIDSAAVPSTVKVKGWQRVK